MRAPPLSSVIASSKCRWIGWSPLPPLTSVHFSTSPDFGISAEIRFALSEWGACPLILIAQGKFSISAQSGMQRPSGVLRESPRERTNSIVRSLTAAWTGTCSVSTLEPSVPQAGSKKSVLLSGAVLPIRNSRNGPTAGSASTPVIACRIETAPSGLRPLVCCSRLTRYSRVAPRALALAKSMTMS